jgi:hypothetical protein
VRQSVLRTMTYAMETPETYISGFRQGGHLLAKEKPPPRPWAWRNGWAGRSKKGVGGIGKGRVQSSNKGKTVTHDTHA